MAEALIWGASGGIGGALASALLARGWRVYGAARDERRCPPGLHATFAFDARDPFSFDAVAYAAAQAGDALDLVVYAVGLMRAQTAADADPASWDEIIDVNLNGAHRAARASLPLLREGGHFGVIGAQVDKISLPRFGAYAAAKAGLEPLLAVLAKEHRKLKFSLYRPGAVDTPFWANVPFKLPTSAAAPASIAEAILARYDAGESGSVDL